MGDAVRVAGVEHGEAAGEEDRGGDERGGGMGGDIPGWMQYGGGRRVYENVDIGPTALLKVVLVPQGFKMPRGGARIC